MSDANWNTVAIVGKTSTSPDVWGVEERYAYQPYATPIYLNPDFSDKTTQESSYAVENLFQGLAFSPVTILYPGRYRVLQPALGTWNRRDPLIYEDSPNLYTCNNCILDALDPSGLLSLPTNPITLAEQRRGRRPWGDSAQHCWAACYAAVTAGQALATIPIIGADIGELISPSQDWWRDIQANHYGHACALITIPVVSVCWDETFCDWCCET